MIIDFKIFENENKSISFILNDLIPYFEDKVELWMSPWIGDEIKDFLNNLLMNRVVKFDCNKCLEFDIKYDSTTAKWYNKTHKGLVKGIGYGYNNKNKIYLTLTLNRIKYNHNVNVNNSITVYGDISDDLLEIIEGVNLLSNSKKYNL